MRVEYLIIGQGIAGSLLAQQLADSNKKFLVIDSGEHNASKTAAGIYNPVVLKRFTPVWQAQSQIIQAKKTFAQLAEKLKKPFDYQQPLYRIFHNDNERDTWSKKAKSDVLTNFLGPITSNVSELSPDIQAPFGSGLVQLTGHIDVRGFLLAYAHKLSATHRLLLDNFQYHLLTKNNNGWQYNHQNFTIQAQRVVFCEGYGLVNNPYFNDLPLHGNKGETLVIYCPNLSLQAIVKSSCFILPLPERGPGYFLVGSTYDWHEKNTVPTMPARIKLLKQLDKILKQPYEVIEHYAGMRPTVIDRRPLLGEHPIHRSLYVLNGLGTRGVMLGATMAQHLYLHMERDQPLDPQIDIQRFYNPTSLFN